MTRHWPAKNMYESILHANVEHLWEKKHVQNMNSLSINNHLYNYFSLKIYSQYKI